MNPHTVYGKYSIGHFLVSKFIVVISLAVFALLYNKRCEMLLIPLSPEGLLLCFIVAVLFEVCRIVVAYMLARPTSQVQHLEATRLETQHNISKIKSVQLEFVKHSKLQRQLIKCEKELEQIQSQYAPKALRVKKIARICRAILYSAIGIYLWSIPVLSISSEVLWPLSIFASGELIQPPAWFLMFVIGGATRHLLRTAIPLVFAKTVFP